MHYADAIGLDTVLATIEEAHKAGDDIFEPAPLLKRLVAEGRDFASLNG
jgi:3-hydroxyacyl-CoA dehydrogenase